MKEIEKDVTEKRIVYEISKEELKEIIDEAREKGRYEAIAYIEFSIRNYIYRMDLSGIMKFMEDIIYFVKGYATGIRNNQNISFKDFLKHYKIKERV